MHLKKTRKAVGYAINTSWRNHSTPSEMVFDRRARMPALVFLFSQYEIHVRWFKLGISLEPRPYLFAYKIERNLCRVNTEKP